MAQELEQTPLEYGKLAPEFSLMTLSGQKVTRSQFRNKSALVLIFFQPTPEAANLLQGIVRDTAEYAEINAQLIGIGRATQEDLALFAKSHDLSLTLLADPQGIAWKAYSGVEKPGYGAFVLDMYGGVDSQKVTESISELPDATTILTWARAAQYRCNI
jgi:peroxiredoxin